VTGGTLAFGANGHISSTSGLTLDGGTLAGTASVGYTKAITLGNGGGTIDVSAGSLTLSGVISGSGSLTSTSTDSGSALTLSGNNTYTGGTTLIRGILQFDHNNAVGTGTFTIDGSSTELRAGGAARTLGNALVLNNTLALAGSNALTFTGAVDLNGADRTIINLLNVDLTFSGVISNGSLTIDGLSGTGAVVLSGANSHTNTTINSNILSVAGVGNLGTGTLTLNDAGAILLVTGATTITKDLTLGSSGGTISNSNAVTLSGAGRSAAPAA